MPAGLPATAAIEFPLLGVDTAFAPSLQRAGTTRAGTNVLAQDPFERRLRGGSRTGLSRWIDARVNGVAPVQCLDVIVTQAAASQLYAFDQSEDGPGVRIADDSTSNYPDGPGLDGPGGGPDAPAVGDGTPPFAANFNRRKSDTATVPRGGNGIMQVRTTEVSPPPPPPPPPGPVTRTYTPYVVFQGGEGCPTFRVGPFTEPLTPPTNLDPTVLAAGGNAACAAMLTDLETWAGTSLPTLAEVNALVLANGGVFGSPGEAGPYETAVDS